MRLRLEELLRLLHLARPRPVIMTVRVDEVRRGDRIYPRSGPVKGEPRRRVAKITQFDSSSPDVPRVYLMTVSGGRQDVLHVEGDLVEVERRYPWRSRGSSA